MNQNTINVINNLIDEGYVNFYFHDGELVISTPDERSYREIIFRDCIKIKLTSHVSLPIMNILHGSINQSDIKQ